MQHRDAEDREKSLLEGYTGTDLLHHPALPPRIHSHQAKSADVMGMSAPRRVGSAL